MKKTKGRKVRDEQEKILIVCEGESEKEYCTLLKGKSRATGVSIKITDAGSGVVEVYKTAQDQEKINRKNPFDKIICVFDDDNLPRSLLSNYIKNMVQDGYTIIYSNICFEQWLIFHLEKSKRAFLKPKDAEERLKKIDSTYKKGKINEQLYMNSNALRQAIEISDSISKELNIDINPSTTFPQLLRILKIEYKNI